MKDINNFYQDRIGAHGLTYKTVWGDDNDWKSRERFKIIETTDFAPNDTLIDLGAGIGSLKAYLNELKAPVEYVAVDVVPDFLNKVNQDYKVQTLNIDFYNQFDSIPIADWYAVFGSLNKKWLLGLSDNDDAEAVIYPWLIKLFNKARKGLYISFFTDRTTVPKPSNIHINPERLVNLCGSAAVAYRIRHDTSFFEFTLMVRK